MTRRNQPCEDLEEYSKQKEQQFENLEVQTSSVYLRKRESQWSWNTVNRQKYNMKWGHRDIQGPDHAELQRPVCKP